jgi:hypothetical protein
MGGAVRLLSLYAFRAWTGISLAFIIIIIIIIIIGTSHIIRKVLQCEA